MGSRQPGANRVGARRTNAPNTLTESGGQSLSIGSIPASTLLSRTSGTTIAGVTATSGLTLTDTQLTNDLVTGKAGGQTASGGTGSGDNLTLQSTTNATKGKILFGSSAYDEVNQRLGILTNAPSFEIHVSKTSGGSARIQVEHNNSNAFLTVQATNNTFAGLLQVQNTANDNLGGILTLAGRGSNQGTTRFGVSSNSSSECVTSRGQLFVGCITANDVIVGSNNTERFRIDDASGLLKVSAGFMSANGSVATAMSSLGPTGSHTTIQEWLTIKNSAGTTRWIPCF